MASFYSVTTWWVVVAVDWIIGEDAVGTEFVLLLLK